MKLLFILLLTFLPLLSFSQWTKNEAVTGGPFDCATKLDNSVYAISGEHILKKNDENCEWEVIYSNGGVSLNARKLRAWKGMLVFNTHGYPLTPFPANLFTFDPNSKKLLEKDILAGGFEVRKDTLWYLSVENAFTNERIGKFNYSVDLIPQNAVTVKTYKFDNYVSALGANQKESVFISGSHILNVLDSIRAMRMDHSFFTLSHLGLFDYISVNKAFTSSSGALFIRSAGRTSGSGMNKIYKLDNINGLIWTLTDTSGAPGALASLAMGEKEYVISLLDSTQNRSVYRLGLLDTWEKIPRENIRQVHNQIISLENDLFFFGPEGSEKYSIQEKTFTPCHDNFSFPDVQWIETTPSGYLLAISKSTQYLENVKLESSNTVLSNQFQNTPYNRGLFSTDEGYFSVFKKDPTSPTKNIPNSSFKSNDGEIWEPWTTLPGNQSESNYYEILDHRNNGVIILRKILNNNQTYHLSTNHGIDWIDITNKIPSSTNPLVSPTIGGNNSYGTYLIRDEKIYHSENIDLNLTQITENSFDSTQFNNNDFKFFNLGSHSYLYQFDISIENRKRKLFRLGGINEPTINTNIISYLEFKDIQMHDSVFYGIARLGVEDQIWYTKDVSTSWNKYTEDLPKFSRINTMHINAEKNIISIGTTNQGLWEAPLFEYDSVPVPPDTITTTSINQTEEELRTAFTIYPNPASNKLQIKSNLNTKLINQVKIIDLQGRTILNKMNLNNSEINIDVSNLNPGFYLTIINEEIKSPLPLMISN
ncbi:MAG: hypothetical protein ACJATA_001749 [Sphingobacteriales bacterium]|jgi:hypothetical protein